MCLVSPTHQPVSFHYDSYMPAAKLFHLDFGALYRVAQKLWPKRSSLLWPYHLRNETKSSWNAFRLSAIRGFYQNNKKICSFFVHFRSFQSFSATSDQLLLWIHITSCLASRILLTLKKWANFCVILVKSSNGRKVFQEDLDSLRNWYGHNKLERLGHNFWATLYKISK